VVADQPAAAKAAAIASDIFLERVMITISLAPKG
jgi:hypothetical protein